jgi:hypothetical protein
MNTKNGIWTLLNVSSNEERIFSTFDKAYAELCTLGKPELVDKESDSTNEHKLYKIVVKGIKSYYLIDFVDYNWTNWVKRLTIS